MENECRFTGNVGNVDANPKYVRVSVAVYGGKTKEGEEKTQWVTIWFRGNMLDRGAGLQKGDLVTCRTSYRTWEKDGKYEHAFEAMGLLVLRRKTPAANPSQQQDAFEDNGDDVPF